MSEKSNLGSQIKSALDCLIAASEFGNETGIFHQASRVSTNNRGVVKRVEAYTPRQEVFVSYGDPGLSADADVPSGEQRARAEVIARAGTYNVEIGAHQQPEFISAIVERAGYRHAFTPNNRQRAAELIMTLAARYIAGKASDVVDHGDRAREAYLNTIQG